MSTRVFRRTETVPIKAVALGDGRPLQITIRRQTVSEWAAFDRQFWKVVNRETNRLLLVRRPGEEQERVVQSAISAEQLAHFEAQLTELQSPEGLALEPLVRATRAIAISVALMAAVQPNERYIISDDEICRRRLLELPDSQREVFETLKKRDDAAFETCITDAFPKFITVPAGQITLEWDGAERDVTTGADLLLCLGSHPDALFEILLAIRSVNALEADAKNESRSRSISTLGSTSSDRTAVGEKPETAAPSANSPDSATTAAAMPIVASPSGPTVN
jgi:hypothetical protein